MRDEIGDRLSRLSIAVERWLLLGPLNVVEVEEVRVQNDLRAVVEEHTVATVRKHVAKAVLRAEVHKLDDKLGARLAL